ncbi:MAG TPA: hypothetical protein VHK90_11090, partial [Thermoanaerobaculia bacterium]|nr:hypothetical protein [Thermoanaerobaculia bacterium]
EVIAEAEIADERLFAVLRTNVLAKPPRPGEQTLIRDFGLRYDFPDAWYAFYKDGKAEITLDRARLPFNQQNFKVKAAHFRIVTKQGVAANNIKLKVTGPNGASGTVTTNASGIVSTSAPALAGIVNANPVGKWKIEVVEGPSLLDAGVMKFDRVYNVQFGLEYSFDFVPEAV